MTTTRRQFFTGPLTALALTTIASTPLRALIDTRDPDADAFLEAIIHGDLGRVRRWLDKKPSLLKVQDPAGRSAFARALLGHRRDVADLLRARGHEPDLHESALALDWERFATLAQNNPPEVHKEHPIGGTAMHAAAIGGAGTSIWRVYAQGGEPNRFSSVSPLQRALEYPDRSVAELTAASLLANGADPSRYGADHPSPLHIAAARGSLELVEMLIRKAAPIDARDDEQRTAHEIAEQSGHRNVAELLEKHSTIPRDHSTSRYAYTLEGAPYRAPRMGAFSPIEQSQIVGTAHGDLDKLRQQIGTRTALTHAQATTTEMAVEAGAHMGRQDVVEFLLEGGAPYSLPTAVMRGDTKRVRELLKEDPQRIHERGAHDFALLWYPLIGRTGIEMVELLLGAGAEVERQHHLGTTALHFAAIGGNLEIADLLLRSGADPKRVGRKFDPRGQTPLQLAEQRGHDRLARLLRDRGA